jgi:type IX secretion system PorP/SprF family membrane protein
MKTLLITVIVGFTGLAFGQQLPQYSQYSRNQFMVNPAAAGIYDFVDITIGGRYQWAGFANAPVTTYAYGSAVLKKKYQRYNPSIRTSAGPIVYPKVNTGKVKHAIGGQIVGDQYGAFRKISFSGTYAIHLPISENYNLSFGTRLGLSNNSFLQDRAVVLSQSEGYTGPIYDDLVYNDFVADQSSLNYLDIGAGLYVYSKDLFLGVSADQLTRDMVMFGSGLANFDPRMHLNAIAGVNIRLNDKMKLMPSALLKMVPNAPLSIDASVQLEFQEKMWLGATYRHGDAAVVMLGACISQRFKFGYSYDFAILKLNNYTSGGHELVLGVMIGR